eukprot:320766-Rhodomonas_salina.1
MCCPRQVKKLTVQTTGWVEYQPTTDQQKQNSNPPSSLSSPRLARFPSHSIPHSIDCRCSGFWNCQCFYFT